MEVVGIRADEVKAITSVLAAIYHLGSAGAMAGLLRACYLLMPDTPLIWLFQRLVLKF